MSGNIKLRVREGKSLDKKHLRYPEWYWEVTGEDGVTTTISPRYDDLHELLKAAIIHELINDRLRTRKPDEMIKRRKFELNALVDVAQTFVYRWVDVDDLLNHIDPMYVSGNLINASNPDAERGPADRFNDKRLAKIFEDCGIEPEDPNIKKYMTNAAQQNKEDVWEL